MSQEFEERCLEASQLDEAGRKEAWDYVWSTDPHSLIPTHLEGHDYRQAFIGQDELGWVRVYGPGEPIHEGCVQCDIWSLNSGQLGLARFARWQAEALRSLREEVKGLRDELSKVRAGNSGTGEEHCVHSEGK